MLLGSLVVTHREAFSPLTPLFPAEVTKEYSAFSFQHSDCTHWSEASVHSTDATHIGPHILGYLLSPVLDSARCH